MACACCSYSFWSITDFDWRHYKLLSKFILFSAQPDITFSCPNGVSKPSWSRHNSVYLTDQMQLSSPQWNCRSGELTRASDPPVWRSGSSWPAGPSRFPQTRGHSSLTAASLHPAAAAGPEKHRSASLCGCGRVITPSMSLWHPPPLPTLPCMVTPKVSKACNHTIPIISDHASLITDHKTYTSPNKIKISWTEMELFFSLGQTQLMWMLQSYVAATVLVLKVFNKFYWGQTARDLMGQFQWTDAWR